MTPYLSCIDDYYGNSKSVGSYDNNENFPTFQCLEKFSPLEMSLFCGG
jgi:hypothetical protein